MRALAVNAAKGQHRAQRLFAELLASVESSRKILNDQWLETAVGYKVERERELDRRERLGLTGLPEPLPHPDHVVINFDRGTATIVGPATKEEKAECDWFLCKREAFAEELAYLEEQRAASDDPRAIAMIEEEIGQVTKILGIIDSRLPARRGSAEGSLASG